MSRAVAVLLVLALAGPPVAAAACELACALAHDHGASSSSQASCHGHDSSTGGSAVHAYSSAMCHESGELLSAIVDAALSALVAHSVLPPTIVLDDAAVPRMTVRARQRGVPFDPRPAHRPLRV